MAWNQMATLIWRSPVLACGWLTHWGGFKLSPGDGEDPREELAYPELAKQSLQLPTRIFRAHKRLSNEERANAVGQH